MKTLRALAVVVVLLALLWLAAAAIYREQQAAGWLWAAPTAVVGPRYSVVTEQPATVRAIVTAWAVQDNIATARAAPHGTPSALDLQMTAWATIAVQQRQWAYWLTPENYGNPPSTP
jgi:hypothetical protein